MRSEPTEEAVAVIDGCVSEPVEATVRIGEHRGMTTSFTVGGRTIDVTSPERVMFPAVGITKAELVGYYAEIAPVITPHVAERPLTLKRFPQGVEGKGFFQKQAPKHFPAWIPRVDMPKKGGVTNHPVVEHPATLAYAAQQGMVTPHIGMARRHALDRPDRFVVDLDPSTGDFDQVRRIALVVADLFREIGLAPFALVTGSSGIHITTPLDASLDFEGVHYFARALATLLLARFPDDLTIEFSKANRGDRIYLDLGRNGFPSTVVAPYGVRSRPTAPVAAPVAWDEVTDPSLRPTTWTLRTIRERIAEVGDLWSDIDTHARPLRPAAEVLLTLSA